MEAKKIAVVGTGPDSVRLLMANMRENTDYLEAPAEDRYIAKSPGLPVKCADGVIVHMNRAMRRLNGVIRVRRQRIINVKR